MIFSTALGEMDLDQIFDDEVTIEEFLHKNGGDCLKDAEFYVFMDAQVTEEDIEIGTSLRSGVEEYNVESFIKQAKIKHIENELRGTVASTYLYEVHNSLDAWFGESITTYLGDGTGDKLIRFAEVLDGDLNEVAYNNYKQHMGRVIKNKRKMYVDFADAKEFTHLYIDVDPRRLEVLESSLEDEELFNFKKMSKDEFKKTLEDNIFPYIHSQDASCYDVLEQAAEGVIEEMKAETHLWTNHYVEIVDNFYFEKKNEEESDLPRELMEPMEQISMVAA